jgi:chorismate mutase
MAQEARDKMEFAKEVAEAKIEELKAALDTARADAAIFKLQADKAYSAQLAAESNLRDTVASYGDEKVGRV